MASSPSPELPPIPGIDQAELLDRIGGDQALCRELLLELSSGYRDYPQRIARGLDEDIEEATRLAHTLKGVLGNLAAMDLHVRCSNLHQAIRQGDVADCRPLLEALDGEFQALCDAIDHAAASGAGSAAAASPPQDWLRERYGKLADALKGNRVRDCKALLREIATSDLSDQEHTRFAAIEGMVRSYQFKDALVLVEDRLHE